MSVWGSKSHGHSKARSFYAPGSYHLDPLSLQHFARLQAEAQVANEGEVELRPHVRLSLALDSEAAGGSRIGKLGSAGGWVVRSLDRIPSRFAKRNRRPRGVRQHRGRPVLYSVLQFNEFGVDELQFPRHVGALAAWDLRISTGLGSEKFALLGSDLLVLVPRLCGACAGQSVLG